MTTMKLFVGDEDSTVHTFTGSSVMACRSKVRSFCRRHFPAVRVEFEGDVAFLATEEYQAFQAEWKGN